MSDDEPVDIEDSPFPNFWDKEEKKPEIIPKTAQEVPGFEDFYPPRSFFDKAKFLPAMLSAIIRKHNCVVTLKDTDETYIYNSKTGVYEHTRERRRPEAKSSILPER